MLIRLARLALSSRGTRYLPLCLHTYVTPRTVYIVSLVQTATRGRASSMQNRIRFSHSRVGPLDLCISLSWPFRYRGQSAVRTISPHPCPCHVPIPLTSSHSFVSWTVGTPCCHGSIMTYCIVSTATTHSHDANKANRALILSVSTTRCRTAVKVPIHLSTLHLPPTCPPLFSPVIQGSRSPGSERVSLPSQRSHPQSPRSLPSPPLSHIP